MQASSNTGGGNARGGQKRQRSTLTSDVDLSGGSAEEGSGGRRWYVFNHRSSNPIPLEEGWEEGRPESTMGFGVLCIQEIQRGSFSLTEE
mmetsp:Transcript_4168/g.8049  ORF Transcript_4168/g.8049 Transcript_4168/m.8049 type:complete len:90 (-) Transcript_4168:2440-2709(-)